MDYTEYTKFFIAILSIVDPLAALPVYFAMTKEMPASQLKKLPTLLGLTITITLVIALFLGESILAFFGISNASFRIAGGLLLLITAYQMFASSSLANVVNSQDLHSQGVVPLAIPLLAGPGAISTVIVYATRHDSLAHFFWMTICILLLGVVITVFFRMASVLMNRISPLFMAISSKIMGLIIGAIAVEFISNGIRTLILSNPA